MPAQRPSLTPEDAARHVRERSLVQRAATPSSSPRVGVELEFLTYPLDDPCATVAFEVLAAAAETVKPLLSGGRVTFEPGGQVELRSQLLASPGEICRAVATDLAVLRQAVAEHGVGLAGLGLDPVRAPHRIVDSPRYQAMEAYFDAAGNAGRTMMCSTAAIQVNVDLGPDPVVTWRLAHDLGPELAAAFANSPLLAGVPSGWRSTRLATWWAIDPSRTRPLLESEADPVAAWTGYALFAKVMLVRLSSDHFQPVLGGMRFADWAIGGHEGLYPTLEDFEYHLTTLFPPVRPRGWLELRMVDALPDPWWVVPVAVVSTLLGNVEVAAAAAKAAAPARGLWRSAACYGLAHPVLAKAAQQCFCLTLEALDGQGIFDGGLVAAYHERYVARRRCPADDCLAAWPRRGTGVLSEDLDVAPG